MRLALVGFIALLPVVGFAASGSGEIVERTQALSAMLAPRLEKELRTAEEFNHSRATPSPAEDLTRDLENKAWREEDLANRLGENLISEPPRTPLQGSWNAGPAYRVKGDLNALLFYSKSVDLYVRLEKSWADRGDLAKAREMREKRAKSLERLRASADNVAKNGPQFIGWSKRGEFRRLAKQLTEACAAVDAELPAPVPSVAKS